MANKYYSQLNETTTVENSDVFAVETTTETKKVTKENFLKEINEEIENIITNKYDDVSISENQLSFKANGIIKNTITLPNNEPGENISGNADTVDGYHVQVLTKTEYDELSTKNEDTLYAITDVEEDGTFVCSNTIVTENVIQLTNNKHQIANITNNTEVRLPNVSTCTEIHLYFNTTTDLTLTFPNIKWQTPPKIEANKYYEFIFTYTTCWLGGCVSYE